MSSCSTVRTHSSNPDFNALIRLLNEDLWRRYPQTQQDFDAFNVIKDDARVVVAYLDGTAAGCGCYRNAGNSGTVEIKRMYVKEEARGRKIGRRVLAELEQWAVDEQKRQAILETIINQPEAIA